MANRSKKRYYVFALLLLLWVMEGTVRLLFAVQGYTVGSFAPNWFPKVEKGVTPHYDGSYYTDDSGLFRASQHFWQKEGLAVNSFGFIGKEWLPLDTTKPRLLLLGDSFAWGAGAQPIDSSYAAKLAQQSVFNVYNTGIPGADPAQYQLVAERYIPLLKPDVVVVCVYMGNDLVADVRVPKPREILYYPTDKGWFPGYYKGMYFNSLHHSYEFYQRLYSPRGWFQQLVCHTAIGTALYSLPLRLQEREERRVLEQSNVTNQHLLAVKALADAHGAKLVVVPIPYSGTDFAPEYIASPKNYMFQRYANVIKGLEQNTVVVPFQAQHFHPLPDGHFNNTGHLLLADSLNQLLTSLITH